MDSTCSRLIIGDKQKFLSLSIFEGGNVLFGDDKNGTITRVAKIGKSESRAWEDVYHVEGLKRNLLSISQLCNKGHKVILTFVGCKVKKMDTNEIVPTAKRHKNMYKVDIIEIPGTRLTCLSAVKNDSLICHKRLGHQV